MHRTNSGMAQPGHSIFFSILAGVLAIALMISLALAPRLALSADEIVEEVVVTGSYIKRSVQEQPNPVDLFDRSEWEEQGSPQMVEIIRNNPAMSGTLNQQEQYSGSGTATGLKNINIRGLGAERSLVLMNGKRMVVTGATVGKGNQYVVDIGAFPTVAMERIELLKNGGSVNYGTDAMAGVWNFITRDEFEGLEISYNHGEYDKSEGGDQSLGMIFGVASDRVNWVTSFEYENRDRLNVFKKGLVDYKFNNWNIGKSSFGNPGTFTPADYDTTNQVVDPACGYDFGNGGTAMEGQNGTWSQCGYTYVPFANIIDPQDRTKIYSQMKFAVNDNLEVYGEILFARLDTVYEGSPSYPPTNPGANYFTFVPLDNPGFADLMATGMTDEQQAGYTDAGGALWWGRSLAGQGPAVSFPREHTSIRVVGGARGMLPFEYTGGLDFDVSVAYSEATSDVRGTDVLTARFDQAVNGVGGPNCPRASETATDESNDALRGDASQGCSWFNPVGSSITAAPGSALYNDQSLRDWFTGLSSGITENRLLVTDAVLSGELPFEVGFGAPAFAFGGQYRTYESDYNPTGDNRVDGAQPSPFHFLGVARQNYLKLKNWAIFGEMAFQLSDRLDVEIGVRHEDYERDAVTKPKFAGRLDINDYISLRASYEQVFRTGSIPSQPTINLELYAPLGEYLSIETPVPTGLDPEESDNFNIGAIITPIDNLTLTVDYYNMALAGPFGREAATCGCADLITNDAGQVNKIIAELINGDDIETDGIDVEVDYTLPIDSGLLSFGANANYILSFDVFGELAADGSQTGNAYDAVGLYNVRSSALPIEVRSMPEFKVNAWAGWSNEMHNVRLYARYIDGMDVTPTSSMYGRQGITAIDDMLSFDAHYSVTLMDENLKITVSALNLTDEDPPLTPNELAYDAYTHNPLGRVLQVGVRYTMF